MLVMTLFWLKDFQYTTQKGTTFESLGKQIGSLLGYLQRPGLSRILEPHVSYRRSSGFYGYTGDGHTLILEGLSVLG